MLLTGVLFPLVILGIDPHNDDPAKDKPYFAWLLLLEAGVMGSFLSLDLFLFFVFFEIVLVPMYFLIGGWGYEGRVVRRHQVLPVHDDRARRSCWCRSWPRCSSPAATASMA